MFCFVSCGFYSTDQTRDKVQYNTMQCNAVQCNAILYNAIRSNACFLLTRKVCFCGGSRVYTVVCFSPLFSRFSLKERRRGRRGGGGSGWRQERQEVDKERSRLQYVQRARHEIGVNSAFDKQPHVVTRRRCVVLFIPAVPVAV